MAKVKNWTEFQHYKNRCPPWIKLQKSLLDDYEFACLPLASKALAPLIWLLASETTTGDFDGNPVKLAFRLRWPVRDIATGLIPLIQHGFIVDASDVLAACLQHAEPEAEGEGEKSKIKSAAGAADFKSDLWARWKAMPNGGGGAFLSKLFRDHKPEQRVMEAVEQTLDHAPADPKGFVLGVLRKEAAADDVLADLTRRMI